MNFDEAIRAHTTWKSRIAAYLRRPDGSLDPKVVGSDCECPLGRWLAQQGPRDDLWDLVTLHTQFHKEAARIVQRADAGQPLSAETALGAASPYGTVSSKLFHRLTELRSKAA